MATQSTSELPAPAPVRVQPVVSRRRTVELGAMSPKLSKQLVGLNVPKDSLRILDKLAESVTWCYLHGLHTEAEHERASRKLLAKVQVEVTKAANKQI